MSDIQSEAGIIGTLIKHPDYIEHSDYLKPNYFINKENSCFYWAIRELFLDGITTIDDYNISNKISSNSAVQKKLDKFNLPAIKETMDLYESVGRNSLAEYKQLVNNVVSCSFKRDLSKTLDRLNKRCGDLDESLDDLNIGVYHELDKLTERYIVHEEVHTLGDNIDEIWEEIESRRNEDGTFGMPSKFPSFYDYFTYENSELVVIQARRKNGKSVFLMNETVHKLQNDVAVLVVDSEMSTRLYTERLLAHLTKIDIKKIKNGRYSPEEAKTIKQTLEWIKSKKLVHIYDPSLSMNSLYSLCRMLQNKIDLGFVVYDYLKSNEKSTGDNYNVLGAKADFLKNKIAGELNLPVLAACQLNRHNEIADSEKINMYCSVAIKWWLKTQEQMVSDGVQCGNAAAKIYVNRLGAQMDEFDDEEYLDFIFDGSIMTIQEAEKHETDHGF